VCLDSSVIMLITDSSVCDWSSILYGGGSD
jgi:hypothetical protein